MFYGHANKAQVLLLLVCVCSKPKDLASPESNLIQELKSTRAVGQAFLRYLTRYCGEATIQ